MSLRLYSRKSSYAGITPLISDSGKQLICKLALVLRQALRGDRITLGGHEVYFSCALPVPQHLAEDDGVAEVAVLKIYIWRIEDSPVNGISTSVRRLTS